MPESLQSSHFLPDDRGAGKPEEYVELIIDNADVKRAIASSLRVAGGKPGTAAIKELVDNIFDWADKTPNQTTQAIVTLPSFNQADRPSFDRLKVEGIYEEGMNVKGIQKAVTIGRPGRTGSDQTEIKSATVGYFGVGFQAATIGSGKHLLLVAKARGEGVQHTFNEPGYGDFQVTYSGKRPILTTDAPDKDCGRVDVTVSGLRLSKEEFPGRQELVREMAERYRPRIASEKVSFDRRANNRVSSREMIDKDGHPVKLHDKLVAFVSGGKKHVEQVLPLDYQLTPEGSEKLQVARTSKEEVVPFWIAEKGPGAKDVEPGLRYYLTGILIHHGGLAGHDKADPRLSRVIGGVHVDNVDDFAKEVISLSKSANQINKSAPSWTRVDKAIHEAISPYIEEIKRRPTETIQAPKGLDRVLQDARMFADMVIAETLTNGVVTRQNTTSSNGENRGQQRPRRSGEKETEEDLGINLEGKKWEDQTGRTFPSAGSTSSIPRKRKGLVHEGRFISFEEGDPRVSTITAEAGRRILYVNDKHPEVSHLLAMMEADPEAARVALGWVIASELVTHAAIELELGDDRKTLEEITRGRFMVGNLVRQNPLTQMVEKRSTPEPPKANKKRQK